MAISSVQGLLARTLLRRSQREVADAIGMSDAALSRFESGASDPPASRVQELRDYYEAAGVAFTDGNGVRERQQAVCHFRGVDGFRAFMDDVYEIARLHGGDICLFNSRPALWLDLLGNDWYAAHRERMESLGDKVRIRIAVPTDETSRILPTAEHRTISGSQWRERVLYAYGPKLAFLDFSHGGVHIVVLEETVFADSFRMLFDIAWEHATTTYLREAGEP